MQLQVRNLDSVQATLVEIVTDTNEVLQPQQLQDLNPPDVDYQGGVIISGRAPVWLFAYLVHCYHPTRWVATYDPRLGGAVVISRHHPDAPAIGSVVQVKL